MDKDFQDVTTTMTSSSSTSSAAPVDVNVGGVVYVTTIATLTKKPDSRLGRMFGASGGEGSGSGSGSGSGRLSHNGKVFIDRDGVLFRYVLDYLRNDHLVLPENFQELDRLRAEAEYYQLTDLVRSIDEETGRRHGGPPVRSSPRSPLSPGGPSVGPTTANNNVNSPQKQQQGAGGPPTNPPEPGYITIGYRGTFAFGRDGTMADVKFRKLLRILVAGRVSLCKEVFGETLNESRDPDRGDTDRYTSRFFLKHPFLEQAFDMLLDSGFRLVGSCGAGTNGAGDVKPGMDSEECKWLHYNEFVFCRS